MLVKYITDNGTICLTRFLDAEIINDFNMILVCSCDDISDIRVNTVNCFGPTKTLFDICDELFLNGKCDLTKTCYSKVTVELIEKINTF